MKGRKERSRTLNITQLKLSILQGKCYFNRLSNRPIANWKRDEDKYLKASILKRKDTQNAGRNDLPSFPLSE